MKNLLEADESLKRLIQEDVKSLTDDFSETEELLEKLEDSKRSQRYAIRDIKEIKEWLLLFGKYAKNANPDVLVTMIQTFVERIYITDENDEYHYHIRLLVCDSDQCCKHYYSTCKSILYVLNLRLCFLFL